MDFIDACHLSEALAVLDDHGSETKVLAGGTDLVGQLLRREIRPAALLNVRGIRGLAAIQTTGHTHIGAAATHWQIRSSAGIQSRHRALAEAAATVGGRQTQNVGTIAGNVVNASPAADLIPALLVADADVLISSKSGSRIVPVDKFLVGRKRTVLAPDELVTAFSLACPPPRTGEAYLKIGRRKAMEVAIIGLAARVSLDESGSITDARIAVCSLGPTAFRGSLAEAALIGRPTDNGAVARAQQLLQARADPIDDIRSTKAYRLRVLAPLLNRALNTCVARAQSMTPPE